MSDCRRADDWTTSDVVAIGGPLRASWGLPRLGSLILVWAQVGEPGAIDTHSRRSDYDLCVRVED